MRECVEGGMVDMVCLPNISKLAAVRSTLGPPWRSEAVNSDSRISYCRASEALLTTGNTITVTLPIEFPGVPITPPLAIN